MWLFFLSLATPLRRCIVENARQVPGSDVVISSLLKKEKAGTRGQSQYLQHLVGYTRRIFRSRHEEIHVPRLQADEVDAILGFGRCESMLAFEARVRAA